MLSHKGRNGSGWGFNPAIVAGVGSMALGIKTQSEEGAEQALGNDVAANLNRYAIIEITENTTLA
jgi:hypothetical protein